MPPRPRPPQRKPLPPNNVTGKPGSAGIISSSRVTSSPLKATLKPTGTAVERSEAEKKHPTTPASEEEIGNTTDFSSSPTKETDHLGKPRFTGPHVRYIPKPDNKPCSITDSVRRFPTEEATEGNATSPPQNPPTNLTVVTVEGCPSFVILDWEKPLNDTVTEYEVISRENGSFSGKNKSIQITNQTFSTVENLKPDTSYEFQVKPKNPLGEGPASKTVAFSTESGKFYNIGDQRGHGEDHCQFVDSFLDGRTGQQLASDQLPTKEGDEHKREDIKSVMRKLAVSKGRTGTVMSLVTTALRSGSAVLSSLPIASALFAEPGDNGIEDRITHTCVP
ncbi:Target of Nesh-SH3 [Microtus ochrogaster]|uniref:Target of Nesh-SH3 n=1 Tax=Microtus ochrogaster TaxID=79684 RepID=A0A8J6G019_MICOH|nr:Target of Nesh-SH3 [Microtus ochrogaster]